MTGGDLLELGHLVGALLIRIGATGAETAARGGVQGAGHVALQHDALALFDSLLDEMDELMN